MELRRWGKGAPGGKGRFRQWLQVVAGLLVVGWLLLWVVSEILSYPGVPGFFVVN
ncbi:hypothetical protein K9D89_004259 [Salmonella enterica]|uniref:hypothetical protein n=1 Tax=Salmonella enterica TaxID=28901 RepID=UPI0028633D40|nr:hypothetical protein [Salmonella enterica]EHO1435882.1 hypothetical protein [Salmonella enterica]EIB6398140.1 hypothetical protein [Salmonella enterica]ELC4346653.1 hypothetical protein [Salmonella enterica]ELF4914236.1 hypothetical protein [Salmonella enterica]